MTIQIRLKAKNKKVNLNNVNIWWRFWQRTTDRLLNLQTIANQDKRSPVVGMTEVIGDIIGKSLEGQPHTFLNKRGYISQQLAKAKQ